MPAAIRGYTGWLIGRSDQREINCHAISLPSTMLAILTAIPFSDRHDSAAGVAEIADHSIRHGVDSALRCWGPHHSISSPPTRCIARHPRPANHVIEGSPVEGADAISDWFGFERTV